jgi:hypothetical protein
MRHINKENDWFYEFRPYIFIGIGIVGFLSKSAFGSSQSMNFLGFLGSVVCIAAGALIIAMRKDYRKSSFMK